MKATALPISPKRVRPLLNRELSSASSARPGQCHASRRVLSIGLIDQMLSSGLSASRVTCRGSRVRSISRTGLRWRPKRFCVRRKSAVEDRQLLVARPAAVVSEARHASMASCGDVLKESAQTPGRGRGSRCGGNRPSWTACRRGPQRSSGAARPRRARRQPRWGPGATRVGGASAFEPRAVIRDVAIRAPPRSMPTQTERRATAHLRPPHRRPPERGGDGRGAPPHQPRPRTTTRPLLQGWRENERNPANAGLSSVPPLGIEPRTFG